MVFKITLLVVFLVVVGGLFYYVSWWEKSEEIKEKRRKNRIEFIKYQNEIEFRTYMKNRYDIDL